MEFFLSEINLSCSCVLLHENLFNFQRAVPEGKRLCLRFRGNLKNTDMPS